MILARMHEQVPLNDLQPKRFRFSTASLWDTLAHNTIR